MTNHLPDAADYMARDWQREADIADAEHEHGMTREDWEDYQADLKLSAQLDNEKG